MKKKNVIDILADAVSSGDYRSILTCPKCEFDNVLDGCIGGPVKMVCGNCHQEVESFVVLMPKKREVQNENEIK